MTPAIDARESEFQTTLTETLELLGYQTCHVYPLMTKHGWRSGTTAKGWPDVIAVRPPRMLAIEVKGSGRYNFPDEQRAWLSLFSLIPSCRAWLVNPRDPAWDTLYGWMRRPKLAPAVYGFDPMDRDEARNYLDRLRHKGQGTLTYGNH
jgi:hypothetical protein